MQPIFARGNARALQRRKTLRQAAQTDQAPRVALRLQAILLSVQERTTGQIAQMLQGDRPRVHAWIGAGNKYGDEGLLEGHRSGRPAQLSGPQREQLADLLERGPVAQGLHPGVGTAPLIAQILADEFAVSYHPGHVRRWLQQWNFAVQRPQTRWVQADPQKQNRWIRYTQPKLKKTPGAKGR